jgi:hypothetical protein
MVKADQCNQCVTAQNPSPSRPVRVAHRAAASQKLSHLGYGLQVHGYTFSIPQPNDNTKNSQNLPKPRHKSVNPPSSFKMSFDWPFNFRKGTAVRG